MIFEFVLEGLTIKFMSINTTFLAVYCFSDKNQSATSSDLNVGDGNRTEMRGFRLKFPIKKSCSLFFHSLANRGGILVDHYWITQSPCHLLQ